MKNINLWMLATILTICGAMTLTSCSDDNSSEPEQPAGVSKFTIEQLKSEVQGFSVDEVMFAYTDEAIVYDIDEDGKCNIYDLSLNFTSDEKDPEVVSMIQYSGTWKVDNSLANLHFMDELDTPDFELMGSLMLNTEMQFDEDGEAPKMLSEDGKPFVVENNDTLAVLRDKETGEKVFISKDDVEFLVVLYEAGMLTDEAEAAARSRAKAFTRAVQNKSLQERIDDLSFGAAVVGLTALIKEGTMSGYSMSFHYFNLNPRICDMSIPCAAAVPSAYIPDGTSDIVGKVKRQYLTIEELWKYGVRFFDLGTIYMPHNDTYGFYDKETGYVNTYITPKQVFEKLKALLDEHPGETAIVMFDQAPELEGFLNSFGWVIKDLKEVMGNRLLTNYGPDLRLEDCRGKLIVMNNFEDQNPEIGMGLCLRNAWSNGTKTEELVFPNGKKGTVNVQAYCEVSNNNTKSIEVSKTFYKADATARSEEPQWFFNYVSGCFKQNNYKNYSFNAYQQNENAEKQLKKDFAKVGIVVFDFVGKGGRGVNKLIDFDCQGLQAPQLGEARNFYAVKNHLISLEVGDIVK